MGPKTALSAYSRSFLPASPPEEFICVRPTSFSLSPLLGPGIPPSALSGGPVSHALTAMRVPPVSHTRCARRLLRVVAMMGGPAGTALSFPPRYPPPLRLASLPFRNPPRSGQRNAPRSETHAGLSLSSDTITSTWTACFVRSTRVHKGVFLYARTGQGEIGGADAVDVPL